MVEWSLFKGISTFMVYLMPKTLLVEEHYRFYLTHSSTVQSAAAVEYTDYISESVLDVTLNNLMVRLP